MNALLPSADHAASQNANKGLFKLLIAQRKVTSAELKLRNTQRLGNNMPQPTPELLRVPVSEQPELLEVRQAVATASAEVGADRFAEPRAMGCWAGAELDLVPPGPLSSRNISLKDISDTPTGANPEVVEAEQTAVKARAAAVLSKLAYVPMVAKTNRSLETRSTSAAEYLRVWWRNVLPTSLISLKREAVVKEELMPKWRWPKSEWN